MFSIAFVRVLFAFTLDVVLFSVSVGRYLMFIHAGDGKSHNRMNALKAGSGP
jgi:hypothetical protein